MPAVQAVLIVEHAATVVPANGAARAEPVVFALQHLKRKQQDQEHHNVKLPPKKEVNAAEMHRQGVGIAGSIINSKTDRYSKNLHLILITIDHSY